MHGATCSRGPSIHSNNGVMMIAPALGESGVIAATDPEIIHLLVVDLCKGDERLQGWPR